MAEVLVTLAIIGVVAALTIPSLINNVQKSKYVTALKKNYSVLNQAMMSLVNDYGGSFTNSGLFTSHDNLAIINAMATKLNFVKNCGTVDNSPCWPNVMYTGLDGSDWYNFHNGDSGHMGKLYFQTAH